jgi:hypothetical protein
LEGGPPRFRPCFTRMVLLRNAHREAGAFRLRDDCPLWCTVPRASAIRRLGNSRWGMYTPGRTPYNPGPATRTRLHRPGLGWIPFRSPLLGESRLISFPPGTEMFQFPGLSRRTYVFSTPYRRITSGGFPHSGIRGSKAIQRLLAAYRSRSRPSSTPGAKASTVCP